IFVENGHQAVRIIRDNTQKLNVESKSDIIKSDAFRALSIFSKQNKQFDLILLDPPYEKISYEKVLEAIQVNDLLAPNGLVYVEASGNQSIVYETTYYQKIYEKKYSNTNIVKNIHFDLILLEPPYEKISYEKVLEAIQVNDLLAPNELVYVEASGNQSIVYETTYYQQIYEKKYSNTTSVMILKKQNQ